MKPENPEDIHSDPGLERALESMFSRDVQAGDPGEAQRFAGQVLARLDRGDIPLDVADSPLRLAGVDRFTQPGHEPVGAGTRSGGVLARLSGVSWRRYAVAASVAMLGLLVYLIVAGRSDQEPSPYVAASPNDDLGGTVAFVGLNDWSRIVAEVAWFNERPEAIRQTLSSLVQSLDVVETVGNLQPALGRDVSQDGPGEPRVSWDEWRRWLRTQPGADMP
ncbi:MAG: hypothetical protein JJU36_03540 [Phycisphaeraceae bacterium]|nr:hypothetical protein [Phycisphaeraceae bacterium]